MTTDMTPDGPGPATGVAAKPPATRKLDLACGQSPKEGFEGVDIWCGAQHMVDLQEYPWPFADESILELHCSHYIEHIPMGYVHHVGLDETYSANKDTLFAFFDECYRILAPDGRLTVVVPSHRSDRAFQDPTHRRFITQQTFAYMNEQMRRDNRLDHYNVGCNFHGDAVATVGAEWNARATEVANKAIQSYWNVTHDWIARMQKMPRLPPL